MIRVGQCSGQVPSTPIARRMAACHVDTGPTSTLVYYSTKVSIFYTTDYRQKLIPRACIYRWVGQPSHKTHRAALVSVSLALSQTPVYTARPRIRGWEGLVHPSFGLLVTSLVTSTKLINAGSGYYLDG